MGTCRHPRPRQGGPPGRPQLDLRGRLPGGHRSGARTGQLHPRRSAGERNHGVAGRRHAKGAGAEAGRCHPNPLLSPAEGGPAAREPRPHRPQRHSSLAGDHERRPDPRWGRCRLARARGRRTEGQIGRTLVRDRPGEPLASKARDRQVPWALGHYPSLSPSWSGRDLVLHYVAAGPGLNRMRVRDGAVGERLRHDTLLASSAPGASNRGEWEGVCRYGDFTTAAPDPRRPNVVWGTSGFLGPLLRGRAHKDWPSWKTLNFAIRAAP